MGREAAAGAALSCRLNRRSRLVLAVRGTRRRQRTGLLAAAGVELGRARRANTGCIMQRSLSSPTCPTSSRGARRTNSTPMCRPT